MLGTRFVRGRWMLDPVVSACVCGLLAIVVHLPALTGGFVFDDVPAVQQHPLVVEPASVGTALDIAFNTNYWGDRPGYDHVLTWRPLTTLSFWANARVGGPKPAGFHGVNLALHGLVTAAAVWFVWLLTGARLAALSAGALFAVLPVHVEAVVGVVNRAELMAALFVLLASIHWIRALDGGGAGHVLAALTFFACGLLSKEHAATWPGIALVLWGHRYARHRWNRLSRAEVHGAPARPPIWTILGVVTVYGAYFWQRAAVLPSALGGDIPYSDNPLVAASWIDRLLGACAVFYQYLRVTFVPVRLTVDYSAHALTMPPSLTELDLWLGAFFMLAGLWSLGWSVRKRRWDLAAALAMFVVWYGLLSHLVLLNTILMAERLMYLPSVAVCTALGIAASGAIESGLSERTRWIMGGAVVVVCLGFGTRSWQRAQDWRDQLTLFSAAVDAFPNSARARHNLGMACLNRGSLDRAELELKAALRLDATDAASLSALGELAFRRGRYDVAKERLTRSLEMLPNRKTLARLCPALVATQDADRAAGVCAAALEARPDDESVHLYLVLALEQSGRLEQARGEATRLRERGTQHPLALAAIARLLGGGT